MEFDSETKLSVPTKENKTDELTNSSSYFPHTLIIQLMPSQSFIFRVKGRVPIEEKAYYIFDITRQMHKMIKESPIEGILPSHA